MNFGYGHDNDLDFDVGFCCCFYCIYYTVECLLSNDLNGIYLKSWEL